MSSLCNVVFSSSLPLLNKQIYIGKTIKTSRQQVYYISIWGGFQKNLNLESVVREARHPIYGVKLDEY